MARHEREEPIREGSGAAPGRGAAPGAEHAPEAAYSEGRSAEGAEAGGEAAEVEITAAMIEAGAEELLYFDSLNDFARDWVGDVYRAMELVRRSRLASHSR